MLPAMCGIVGLYLKNPALEGQLGAHLAAMLAEMGDRGPDSAGFAVYREPAAKGQVKLTLHSPDPAFDWTGPARDLEADGFERRATHAVLRTPLSADAAQARLAERWPGVRVMGCGERIELFKEMGLPDEVARRFDLAHLAGTHAVGHTRMATESAVTTEHSHPFSTGLDLCLVHNGSLSNHNRLRQNLKKRGIRFETDNDSEVAAGYLTWRMSEGASLREALEAGLKDLDGFYTFAVGTKDGFAVMRDAFACKPAVLAETDDWVAMSSEYRGIAPLPGAEKAKVWEPKPATVYAWGRA